MAVVPQKQIVNHEEAVTLFMACDMSKADWLLAACMSSEGLYRSTEMRHRIDAYAARAGCLRCAARMAAGVR